ncbi:hypothetical protein PMAYCL1PPCAC_23122 [Pristionchus mayeri]|uniref:Uncharacterized protein n=1 Tax=Pristionchus mayeri TaxID=1317129 RepID=A0AAN5CZK5_9BILA|nr:hypothetical protein PMAYCL1PPCAC_23122 [Pristionchus mayeri]
MDRGASDERELHLWHVGVRHCSIQPSRRSSERSHFTECLKDCPLRDICRGCSRVLDACSYRMQHEHFCRDLRERGGEGRGGVVFVDVVAAGDHYEEALHSKFLQLLHNCSHVHSSRLTDRALVVWICSEALIFADLSTGLLFESMPLMPVTSDRFISELTRWTMKKDWSLGAASSTSFFALSLASTAAGPKWQPPKFSSLSLLR